MAAHKPMIGADVPGIRDVLPQKMLYRHSDFEDLADLVLRVSSVNDIDSLLKEQQQILKRFDLTNIVKKHLEIYRK